MKRSDNRGNSGPAVIAWESTGACNLKCRHCRAGATREPSPDELGTSEVKRLLDELSQRGSALFILSGGEPLLRGDIFEIATYAVERGFRVALASNGTLFTGEIVRTIMESGISMVSVSLDGPGAEFHDSFRGCAGAFDSTIRGLHQARNAGLRFQINTTVARENARLLPDVLSLVEHLGAVAWDVFMLVPVGRALDEEGISPLEYESVLRWLGEASAACSVPIKVTCGPTGVRIWRQISQKPAMRPRGCMAGKGFCFVSRRGEVFPCGYLPISAGSIITTPFWQIYDEAEVFRALRDTANLKGRCGTCEFREVCGGCRARAFSMTGDYMGEDPLCGHIPKQT